MRVFCPVLPVSLSFSRGSVRTLFDSTIYFHFNLFKVRRSSTHLGFRGPLFPLGRAYKCAACIFCNTWFQIPCWQIVHVHINTIMARLSYSSPPFNTKIHCKLVYIYIYISLDKIEGWTERDKQQLDGKEKKIKEAKQKKLETARKSKETVQPPRRENETYADVLKRHIRERLNPSRSENTESTRPNKGAGQGRGNVPSRRQNTWDRSRYPQQPRYFEQRQRFLKWRPPNRSRYKD